ncbi:XapX domain-containing protein [Metallumcola ferriviriculae]|uniref:XapX domain-containing protein n=1 Tax=Metallumcola ferriviriculae TaxID=3039180 RepID=A0AAU0UJK8_9FIRM|nr:XapX domain-containing protein [Desulfitibacteraceae bacterium MK1]
MWQIIFSAVTGMVVGLLFAILRLPVPAPPTVAGVMGIVGIFLGYLVGKRFLP